MLNHKARGGARESIITPEEETRFENWGLRVPQELYPLLFFSALRRSFILLSFHKSLLPMNHVLEIEPSQRISHTTKDKCPISLSPPRSRYSFNLEGSCTYGSTQAYCWPLAPLSRLSSQLGQSLLLFGWPTHICISNCICICVCICLSNALIWSMSVSWVANILNTTDISSPVFCTRNTQAF